jgi:hypothetical protein
VLPREVICLLASAAILGAAEKPANPVTTGFTISTEGGVEGKQVIHYDAQGRPIGGNVKAPPMKIRDGGVNPAAPPSGAPGVRTAQPAAPTGPRQVMSSDGRALPFTMQEGPGAKKVDPGVDPDSALRSVGKSNDLAYRRFDTGRAPIDMDPRYSRADLLTLDSWHGRFDTFGRPKAEIELRDDLGAEVRPKNIMTVKAFDRETSALSGTTASILGFGNREKPALTEAIDTAPRPPKLAEGAAMSLDQISMQDINRFQFRRSRSDAPGIPTVRPGSETIQTTGSERR